MLLQDTRCIVITTITILTSMVVVIDMVTITFTIIFMILLTIELMMMYENVVDDKGDDGDSLSHMVT